jgi:eukaryotic-like serine/threonine-protein kinase
MQPASLLQGRELPGGWKVVKALTRKPTDTGGNFSVGYIVENADGRRGFLKAMDYFAAFNHPDTLGMLQWITNAYAFKKNVCQRCRDHSLKRVVHAIDGGTIQIDPKSAFSKVEYLVFELAEGDIRRHLDAQQILDVAFVLRVLHHVAIGLEQLHSAALAHQDLKPSNVLVFEKEGGSKIGDFGRAWSKDFVAPHDNLKIAGDPGYAPLELLYGYVATDVHTRRYGCDAFHLGSLLVFFFTRVGVTALIGKHLAMEHWPNMWGGTYAEVLPYVQDAFAKALQEFESHTPDYLRKDLVGMVAQLCEPDPAKRGHPLNRQGHVNQFGLERYISKFNLLAWKVELKLIGG